jgi:hypothetical protein
MANDAEFDDDLCNVLNTALLLVTGDRARQHGDAYLQHSIAADFWSTYLRAKDKLTQDLTAADVAQMMLLLKISRDTTGEFNPDTFIDQCGYAALSFAIKNREQPDEN